MKLQRVLLTGGAGLIGSTIADLLTQDTDLEEIVIFDDFSRGTMTNLEVATRDPRLRVVRGNILDVDDLNSAVSGVDAIFHLTAIRITQCAQEPRLANDILVNGTFNILEAAVRQGVKRVVASSSASVYGMAETFPTSERHHPYNNDTIYGAAKAYNEGLLKSFKAMYGLDYVAFRYFNVYGPRMDTIGKYTEVFIRWMNAIENNEPPVIHGDGSATMDFVYVEDIARANLAGLRSDVTDEVFNVGTGVETSLADLARALLKVMGSDLQPVFEPVRSVNAVARRQADVSKAKEMLDFEASVGLEEGLARLVMWWRAQNTDGSAQLSTVSTSSEN